MRWTDCSPITSSISLPKSKGQARNDKTASEEEEEEELETPNAGSSSVVLLRIPRQRRSPSDSVNVLH